MDELSEEQTDASGRSRGRPRSLETDEAILKAAWELLSNGIYDRVTFEAVADRAGCSRPTVYRRFKNKVELVRAMVEPMTRLPGPVAPEHGDSRAILLGYLEAWAAYLVQGGGAMIMALWQARREDSAMSAMLDEIYERGRRPYVDLLKRLSTAPMADADYVILVDAMLGAVLFRCVHCLGEISKPELQLLVDQAIGAARSLEAPPRA
jgi:AcrR family transcriptional regulator